ncbi:hypothetical protein COV58_00870 [Candidatus Roizmanbacteria bacterium CG11_big_fil_rev_8_21_14_0_20_36_8]|uniref:Prepilin-type N-terminal cleavage/methylation domain-containing protein n=2 Tax=Candidatus Roizmaniibacteriota TaxID=1752723 RepID=A0A2M6IUV3_9BACT|nr:MAG: hypothetical protein COV58_00870 [Candidatus Roizmanbacteria bacterium CG11_big_fil_rev_8_21_14_0_20_36_8]PIZ66048.1 MAG: hypothetical protein COY14_01210 [Candidatus Roizmanbacteria bacterium CG_4_10_14_0_2_um_filter_36_9]
MINLKKRGFTLIELLISITVIVLFMGISLSVYQQTVFEKRLTEDASLMVSKIEQVKRRTLSRDISPNFNCLNFDSYAVVFNPAANTFQDQFHCDGNPPVIIGTYLLNGSEYENITVTETINFIPPIAELAGPMQLITLRNSQITKCVDIIVNQLGPVNLSDHYDCP